MHHPLHYTMRAATRTPIPLAGLLVPRGTLPSPPDPYAPPLPWRSAGKTLTTIALIATNKPGVSAQELTPFRGSLVTGLPVAEAEAGQAGDAPAAPQQPAKRRKV